MIRAAKAVTSSRTVMIRAPNRVIRGRKVMTRVDDRVIRSRKAMIPAADGATPSTTVMIRAANRVIRGRRVVIRAAKHVIRDTKVVMQVCKTRDSKHEGDDCGGEMVAAEHDRHDSKLAARVSPKVGCRACASRAFAAVRSRPRLSARAFEAIHRCHELP
jgi:hypothetical protein